MRAGHRKPRGVPSARVWSVLSMIERVVTALTVAVAVSTVLTLAWFNVQHQEVLIVTSGSMAPSFNAGDAVTVEHPDPSRLAVGDVVTFHALTGDKTTTHRIFQLRPGPEGLFLQTKGDANRTPDPNLVPASSVTGVMTGSIPYLGFWLAFFQSPRGKVLILGTPLLMILIGQAISMLRDWRDARQTPIEAGLDDPTVTGPAARTRTVTIPT